MPPGQDRPILRGLEQALNGIIKPGRDAATLEDENAALRRELEVIRNELNAVRARMAELENKLDSPQNDAP